MSEETACGCDFREVGNVELLDGDRCRYPALLEAARAVLKADETANVDYGIAPELERAMKGLRDAIHTPPKIGGADVP